MNSREIVLSAAPAKSGRLDFPSEIKKVFFYFLPMKRV